MRVEAEPAEARGGQHDGVEVALGDARQPGSDVAPDVDEGQVRPQRAELGDPPRRAGAHRRPRGQVGQRQAVAGAEGVAGVGAGGNRGDRQSGDGRRREVLQRVHGQVAAAVEDGGAQFRREDAEGAEARQGAALDVAAGADAHQFDLVSERPQPVGDQLGLADGERGAARAEPEPHPSTRSTPRITGAMPLPSSQAPTRSTPTPAALRRRRSRVEGSILAGIADHSTEANAAT